MAEATRRFGSTKKLRASMKSGGGAGILTRLKADNVLKVRFLQDPEDWHEAYYHWIGEKFFWCSNAKNCAGCQAGVKKGKVALANAVDLQAGKVIIVQLPPSLADPLAARAEKMAERNRSLTDHDIDLSREGSGKNDTRYSFDPDDQRKMNLDRYQLHDIDEVINSELEFQAESAADAEEEPRSSKKSSGDEDDYEDDDEEEEEEESFDVMDLDRAELKVRIKKLDPDFIVKKSHTDDVLREALLDLMGIDHTEDDEEDEDGLDEFKPKKSPAPKAKPRAVVRRAR